MATPEEQMQVLRHYVEVLELHPADEDGLKGTYILKLFPEVKPDRGFDWEDDGPDGGNPDPPTKNGINAESGDDPDLLTEDGLVCMTVRKAPPHGLEP